MLHCFLLLLCAITNDQAIHRVQDGEISDRPAVKAKPRVERNRVLVTGGAGFVGSHLCDFLVARGDHVSRREQGGRLGQSPPAESWSVQALPCFTPLRPKCV
jgi:hypothetical protein